MITEGNETLTLLFFLTWRRTSQEFRLGRAARLDILVAPSLDRTLHYIYHLTFLGRSY